MRHHEEVWLQARKEAGETCGLCTEVAKGPNNQDPVRMKSKKVVLGWIQLGHFNELIEQGVWVYPISQ